MLMWLKAHIEQQQPQTKTDFERKVNKLTEQKTTKIIIIVIIKLNANVK